LILDYDSSFCEVPVNRVIDWKALRKKQNEVLSLSTYDPNVTLLHLALGRALLKFYDNLLYEGSEIYLELFGTIDRKIIELKRKALDNGGCTVSPLEEEQEEPTEELKDIFKRYCKEHHPDINSDDEERFRDVKDKYDRGKFFDFLEDCEDELSGVLYLKWVYLHKELTTLKEKIEVRLALYKKSDPIKFSKVVSDEWVDKRKKIANVVSIMR